MGGNVDPNTAQPQSMDPRLMRALMAREMAQRQAQQGRAPMRYSEGEAFGPRDPQTGQTKLGAPTWAGQQQDPAGALLRGHAAFKPGAVDQFPSSTNIEDRRKPFPGQMKFGQQGEVDKGQEGYIPPKAGAPSIDEMDTTPRPPDKPPPFDKQGVSDPRIESAPGVAREGVYSQAAHRLLAQKPNISGAEFLATMKAAMPFLKLDADSMKASHKMEMDELKQRHQEEKDAAKQQLDEEKAGETKSHHIAEETRKMAEEQRKGFEAITKRQAEERKQLELNHKKEEDAAKHNDKLLDREFKQTVEEGRNRDRALREQKMGQESKRIEQSGKRLVTAEEREKRLSGKQTTKDAQSFGGTEGQPQDKSYKGAAERMKRMKAPDAAGAPDTSTWETRTFQGKTYRLKPNSDRTKQENWIAE